MILICLFIAIIIALLCYVKILCDRIVKTETNSNELANSYETRISNLLSKYGGIINIQETITELEGKKVKVNKEINELNIDKTAIKTEIDTMKQTLSVLENNLYVQDCGVGQIEFRYNTTEEYQINIEKLINKEKELIRGDKAVNARNTYLIDGDPTEGTNFKKRNISLLLSNFNYECNNIISSVNWNNYAKCVDKINNSYQRINKKGEPIGLVISKRYLDLKIQELGLKYEAKELEYKVKEEEKSRKEKYAEEQRELKKLEEDRKRAEREEAYYIKMLNKAKTDIANAVGIKYEEIAEKINWYEEQLKEAQTNKERAISMAQQTRRGYVYVISNIGSFGEEVYKIGLTRRLDPYERIRELSNASVPFKFDVHAMIYSEDAPALENALHDIFRNNRVNKVNTKKEYFKIDLNSIKAQVKELGYNAEFISQPIDFAREYYDSQNK